MAAYTPYTSSQPSTDFSLPFTKLRYSATLAINTDTALTIPGNASRYKAIIKPSLDGKVWVALNATAAVPAGASFAATTSELVNNSDGLCRDVIAGDVLHFISATAAQDVSVVLYSVGTTN